MLKLEKTGMKHTKYYDAELGLYAHVKPMVGTSMTGKIFNDKKERFNDGTIVHTSVVKKIEQLEDGIFVTTRNTVYKLL